MKKSLSSHPNASSRQATPAESTNLPSAQPPFRPCLYVSRKFYGYIIERVVEACAMLADTDSLRVKAIVLINNYIRDGEANLKGQPTEAALIFTILRPEIDRAMARSASARRRAASRRKTTHTVDSTVERTEGNAENSTECIIENSTANSSEDVSHPAYALQRVPTNRRNTKTGKLHHSNKRRRATGKQRYGISLPYGNRKAAKR